jgi:hypothetical protein
MANYLRRSPGMSRKARLKAWRWGPVLRKRKAALRLGPERDGATGSSTVVKAKACRRMRVWLPADPDRRLSPVMQSGALPVWAHPPICDIDFAGLMKPGLLMR